VPPAPPPPVTPLLRRPALWFCVVSLAVCLWSVLALHFDIEKPVAAAAPPPAAPTAQATFANVQQLDAQWVAAVRAQAAELTVAIPQADGTPRTYQKAAKALASAISAGMDCELAHLVGTALLGKGHSAVIPRLNRHLKAENCELIAVPRRRGGAEVEREAYIDSLLRDSNRRTSPERPATAMASDSPFL